MNKLDPKVLDQGLAAIQARAEAIRAQRTAAPAPQPQKPKATVRDLVRGPNRALRGDSYLYRNPQPYTPTNPAESAAACMAGMGLSSVMGEWYSDAGILTTPNRIVYVVEPPKGAKLATIRARREDLERELGCHCEIRNHSAGYIAVAVPRKVRDDVRALQILDAGRYSPGHLVALLGLDEEGNPLYVDIAKAPHILVGGTTGSGKSAMLATIAASACQIQNPDQLRMIIVDTKRVGYAPFSKTPHVSRIAMSPKEAVAALELAARIMDNRYRKMAAEGLDEAQGRWPRILVLVDEFSDTMTASGKETAKRFEAAALRIAQVGRAAGVHLILATQKPIASVVTPILKGNLPCRIGLKVGQASESRVIIDQQGLEDLLGNGDAIAKDLPVAGGQTLSETRYQAAWTPNKDLEAWADKLVESLKATNLHV